MPTSASRCWCFPACVTPMRRWRATSWSAAWISSPGGCWGQAIPTPISSCFRTRSNTARAINSSSDDRVALDTVSGDSKMKNSAGSLAIALLAFCGVSSLATAKPPAKSPEISGPAATPKAVQSVTQASVTVEGHRIDYTATAGTIILRDARGKPTGSMFYVAYVKSGVKDEGHRPVTFFYNGGPGSSSVWLHMGAFGPVRVVTSDHTHTPGAPYKTVSNEYSLLDVTDEVFIDAMGTGYSRIIGKDEGGVGEPKDFYGIDADVASFAQFIKRYDSENDRWNS